MAVEAKVDEPFGSPSVYERYWRATETLKGNPGSRAAARVRDLLSRYFVDDNEPRESRFADVGYQLLTAAAGTVAVEAEVSLFYVAIFRPPDCDEKWGRRNQLHCDNFMRTGRGVGLVQDGNGPLGHELIGDGRHLTSTCEYFST